MWLEKYIFCGKIVGPTSNNLKMAESLALGSHIPLGKHPLVWCITYSIKYQSDLEPINPSTTSKELGGLSNCG
jgi:hypothetical protein